MAIARGNWKQYCVLIHKTVLVQMQERARSQGYGNASEWLRLVIRQELNNRRLPSLPYNSRKRSRKIPYSQTASAVGSNGNSETCPTATGTPQSPPGNTDQRNEE
jgi:hypothetical protein